VVVKLINTDGMAFIGPGSEWFWTALSGVVLAVTFLGIYRQLSIARSANAFEQMNRIANKWDSEGMARHRLEILLALRDGVKPENVASGAAGFVRDFWDDVALLVRAGHVDRRLVYESLSPPCRAWWATLAPVIRRARIEEFEPRLSNHFEWLSGVMAEMDRKAGVGPAYDESYLATTRDGGIERARAAIRDAEELRAVIVRSMSPASLTASPPVVQGESAPAAQPA
jgi:hypothetical protein